MKTKEIIAAILFTIGLLVCFSAAASMDAGASWVTGAIRGAVGIIFAAASVVLGKDVEVEETEEDISEQEDVL